MTEGFNTAHSMIAVNQKKHTSKRQLVQPMRMPKSSNIG
jgi:hypothetical protein